MDNNNALLYVGKTFNSYDEFEKTLKLYQKETLSLYTTRTSKTVAAMNRHGSSFKEELRYYNLILQCKRGGPKRTCSGDGTREYQSTWKIGCPSTIVLHATADNKLKVKDFIGVHENHQCDEEELALYPEVRREALEKCHEDLDLLFEANVKPSKIRLVLRDLYSGPINPRDLMNLKARWKNEKAGGRTESERLVDALCAIVEHDSEAFIFIVKDEETNELLNLFIQTSLMRQNAINYVRVLLMDHTYKINKNRMPTCLLMVMDGNGEGRVAGLSYLANEKKENVTNTLTAFKTSVGQESADKIKTVVIDKDMSEASAIGDVLPNANIQLCDFHVSNTFKLRSAHEKAELRALLKKLRFAHNDLEFNELCEEVKALASANFWIYFDKQWVRCPMAWSFRDKKKSLNLGNTTTARLECFNGKIKIVLRPENTLAESVEGVLGIVANKEEDSLFKTRMEATKEYYSTTCNDPTVHAILNDLTKFAARKYICELRAEVSETQIEFFKAAVNDCSCAYFCSYELPCRHMLQMRRCAGAELYNLSEIKDAMWKKGGLPLPVRAPPFRAVVRCDLKVQPKTAADKYNNSLSLSKKVCSVLSERGAVQYARGHSMLKELYNILAQGEDAMIFRIVDGKTAVSMDGKITITLPESSPPVNREGGSVAPIVLIDVPHDMPSNDANLILVDSLGVAGNSSSNVETNENPENLSSDIGAQSPSPQSTLNTESVVANSTVDSVPINASLNSAPCSRYALCGSLCARETLAM